MIPKCIPARTPPRTPTYTPISIDASLARGIRRGYFRRLAREWDLFEDRRRRAARRNVLLTAEVQTRRQFRDRLALMDKLVGGLLPSCTLQVESGTRAAAVAWALWPDELPVQVHVDSHARLRSLVVLQPGRMITFDMAVCVRAHAVDRVVQRARVVDLPIRDVDMQAINAEFADLVSLASLAASVLAAHGDQAGHEAAACIQVLLPTQHGVFLGDWGAVTRQLEIRTFVDHVQLNSAQREAVDEINRITQAQVCAEALQVLVPGWMGAKDEPLRARLLQAWQHYGWRFSEDRLHPGLSDRAWSTHAQPDSSLAAGAAAR